MTARPDSKYAECHREATQKLKHSLINSVNVNTSKGALHEMVNLLVNHLVKCRRIARP